jgi:hypothetical protein
MRLLRASIFPPCSNFGRDTTETIKVEVDAIVLVLSEEAATKLTSEAAAV